MVKGVIQCSPNRVLAGGEPPDTLISLGAVSASELASIPHAISLVLPGFRLEPQRRPSGILASPEWPGEIGVTCFACTRQLDGIVGLQRMPLCQSRRRMIIR